MTPIPLVLKIKCWNCNRTFTMSPERSEESGSRVVDLVLPCPYCDKPNQVSLTEDQVKSVELYRSKQHDNPARRGPAESDDFQEQIFFGAKPSEKAL